MEPELVQFDFPKITSSVGFQVPCAVRSSFAGEGKSSCQNTNKEPQREQKIHQLAC